MIFLLLYSLRDFSTGPLGPGPKAFWAFWDPGPTAFWAFWDPGPMAFFGPFGTRDPWPFLGLLGPGTQGLLLYSLQDFHIALFITRFSTCFHHYEISLLLYSVHDFHIALLGI